MLPPVATPEFIFDGEVTKKLSNFSNFCWQNLTLVPLDRHHHQGGIVSHKSFRKRTCGTRETRALPQGIEE
jgi:hypothetical protein